MASIELSGWGKHVSDSTGIGASESDVSRVLEHPRLCWSEPAMTTNETTGLNPHEGGCGQPDVQCDGGEPSDEDPDWESIARRSLAASLEGLWETEVTPAFFKLTHAISSGDALDETQVARIRARFSEVEERITHELGAVGALNRQSPAERLASESRSIDHMFRRLSRAARRGDLCQHDLDEAREELRRAQQTLDDLEEELEE